MKESVLLNLKSLKKNLVAYKFGLKYVSLKTFLQLYNCLLWKAHLKFILWFYVILCLTIKHGKNPT